MAEIQEQTQLASEVSEAISSSTYVGVEFDEVRHSSYQSRALSEMSIYGLSHHVLRCLFLIFDVYRTS